MDKPGCHVDSRTAFPVGPFFPAVRSTKPMDRTPFSDSCALALTLVAGAVSGLVVPLTIATSVYVLR